jgi:hypothetical protein
MNKTEYLLTTLMEEAAEVQKVASKCIRFGLDNIKPGKSKSNFEKLEVEINDFYALVEMLEQHVGAATIYSEHLIIKKTKKVGKFMELSRELGTLR